jgi:hypothetical protein
MRYASPNARSKSKVECDGRVGIAKISLVIRETRINEWKVGSVSFFEFYKIAELLARLTKLKEWLG